MISSLRRKTLALLTFIAVASTSSTEAVNVPYEQESDSSYEQNDFSIYEQDGFSPYEGNFSSYEQQSLPRCDSCWRDRFTVEAQALYWKACEEGLSYATFGTDTEVVDGNVTTVTLDERFKNPRFDWDWGCRLGINYELPCDKWGLFLEWTHFNSDKSGRSEDENPADLPQGTGVFPNFAPLSLVSDLVKARYKLQLDYFDLGLKRGFCVTPRIALIPHAGIRVLVAQRKLHEHFENTIAPLMGSTYIGNVDARNRYRSVGICTGLDTNWWLGYGFSLTTMTSGAVLYGEQQVHQFEAINISDGVFQENLSSLLHDDFRACRGVLDFGLGLRWDYKFECFSIAFVAAYENHLYINFNNLRNHSINFSAAHLQVSRGDLSVNGFTFGTEIKF